MATYPLLGGCACGRVRYRIDAAPLATLICHCRTCRRAAGAESVAWLTARIGDFALTEGEMRVFLSSPEVARGFCGACGTSLTWRDRSETIDVTLASLDDPEATPPTRETWLDHRLSWNAANPGLPGHRGAAD